MNGSLSRPNSNNRCRKPQVCLFESVGKRRNAAADAGNKAANARNELADVRNGLADARNGLADVRNAIADVRNELADAGIRQRAQEIG